MNLAVHTKAHQFARGAFEGGVGGVGVGPFDEDGLARTRSGRRDRFRWLVVSVQAWKVGIVGTLLAAGFLILEMDRIKPAVVDIVRIEGKGDEAVGEATLRREPAKQTRLAVAPVEIEIGGELSGLLVEDVEGPFRSLTKIRFLVTPGSSRMKLMRARRPIIWPVPSILPVIGMVAKSRISSVISGAALVGTASAMGFERQRITSSGSGETRMGRLYCDWGRGAGCRLVCLQDLCRMHCRAGVGRAFLPADRLSSRSCRLERRLRPRLAAPRRRDTA
jgi:hypothetical protein